MTAREMATPKHEAPYCKHMLKRGGSFHACYARPATWVESRAQYLCETHAPNDITATELRLFADNDGDLYRQRTRPILANLGKKFRAGTYQSDLACKLWFSWAADAAKRYVAEFAAPGDVIFTKADLVAVALDKEAYERGEFALGNFVE